MANTRASKREIRKSGSRAVSNRRIASRIKTLQKGVSESVEGQKLEVAEVKGFISSIDKAAKSGVIHRNKANRLKSRVTRKLQASG